MFIFLVTFSLTFVIVLLQLCSIFCELIVVSGFLHCTAKRCRPLVNVPKIEDRY